MSRFVDIDGLVDAYPFLSRRVVHQRCSDRAMPHRRLPHTRPLIFDLIEVETWFSDPSRPLDIQELDGNGRIVKPSETA